MLDLEELPLYQEDWLGLASLHNQQKLHKVKSNRESVNILDKLRQLQFDVSNTFFTLVHLFVCDLLKKFCSQLHLSGDHMDFDWSWFKENIVLPFLV